MNESEKVLILLDLQRTNFDKYLKTMVLDAAQTKLYFCEDMKRRLLNPDAWIRRNSDHIMMAESSIENAEYHNIDTSELREKINQLKGVEYSALEKKI